MLQAKTADGKFVTLASIPKHKIEQMRQTTRFFCPACHEQVIVKAGTEVVPHFAHQVNSHCTSHKGGESEYHMKGKLLLKRWLKRQHIPVVLEPFLQSINQIPDLLIQLHDRKIAIEFQCARIPIKEIQQRNKAYKNSGIVPLWILGKKLLKMSYNLLHISPFIMQFIHQFNEDVPTVLYFFCPETLYMYKVSDLYLSSKRRAFYKMEHKQLFLMTFKQFLTVKRLNKKKLYKLWANQLRQFRLRQRHRAYGDELAWRTWLYKKRIAIDQLPSFIYLPTELQQLMTVPPWNWQSRLYFDLIDPLQIGQSFTLHECEQYLKQFIVPQHYYPLLNSPTSPIKQYVQQLATLQIVTHDSGDSYYKHQSFPVYKHIYDAINGDDVIIDKLMYNYS